MNKLKICGKGFVTLINGEKVFLVTFKEFIKNLTKDQGFLIKKAIQTQILKEEIETLFVSQKIFNKWYFNQVKKLLKPFIIEFEITI